MQFDDLIPMLQVADVAKSLAFYRDALGFDLVSPQAVFEHEGIMVWCSIRAGKSNLMLTKRAGGTPMSPNKQGPGDTIFYIYNDDVLAVHQSLRDKGYEVTDPRVTFYQMKEITLEDPDGHTIWLAQHTDERPTVRE